MYKNIAGVILAGGRSSRMKKNKALISYKGKKLIEIMLDKIKIIGINDVFISGDVKTYDCLKDNHKYAGPASAILDILDNLKDYDAVLFLPVDMPLLDIDCLKTMFEYNHGCFYEGNFLPVLIPVKSFLKLDRKSFKNKNISVKKILNLLDIKPIAVPIEVMDKSFLNVNTPENYKALIKEDLSFNLDENWRALLSKELKKPYIKELKEFLEKEIYLEKIIYPKTDEIFNALNLTSFDNVKIVILGQDPYHRQGQAHGLAFSVREDIKIPPSLVNIYKEIAEEFNSDMLPCGDLTHWAEQGVLLLNSSLTVENAKAGSHQNKGWEKFTDAIIREINNKHENIVFMLWGSYAQKKCSFIDAKKHLVLKAPHPSPLSAYRGFFGCGHFKKANEYLKKHGIDPIDWVFSS